jgi:hypothetical protein
LLAHPTNYRKTLNDRSNIVEESDRLLRAIGKVVVRFQQIEQWLAEVLAMLLRMKEKEDQFLVSAAMSFGQKLDLLIEIYPKRRVGGLKEVDIPTVRKALSTAEEFRNCIVHSFWALECSDPGRWLRIKGSLRGRKGFRLSSIAENIDMLEKSDRALYVIREWMFEDQDELENATAVLRQHLDSASNK